MKEELYIIKDGVRMQLDLNSPSGITLKFVSNLFSDLSKLTSSYTYTFSVPMTANNRRIMEMAEDVRVDNGFTKKAVNAEFIVNGVDLCQNATLYVQELNTTYKCVMTWGGLAGFEKLKSDSKKLTELESLGEIEWGKSGAYGALGRSNTSNNADVVYPDYDAGIPHDVSNRFPPKPCVPVYRLIQMINNEYGTDFQIGKSETEAFGRKSVYEMNTGGIYDDYVTHGVIPLVKNGVNNEKYKVSNLVMRGSHTMRYLSLDVEQVWAAFLVKNGDIDVEDRPLRFKDKGGELYYYFYQMLSGEFADVNSLNSNLYKNQYRNVAVNRLKLDKLGTPKEAQITAIGVLMLEDFKGNDFVKPLYGYQHNTGLGFYKSVDSEMDICHKVNDGEIEATFSYQNSPNWLYTIKGKEVVEDSFGTEKQKPYVVMMDAELQGQPIPLKMTFNEAVKKDGEKWQGAVGQDLGVVGFYSRNEVKVKGNCVVRISRSAVAEGRVKLDSFMWMCVAKVEDGKGEPEAVTEKDIDKCIGMMSLDKPQQDDSGDYLCEFDFSSAERVLTIDAQDGDGFKGFVFLPYYPADYMAEKQEETTVTKIGFATQKQEVSTIKKGQGTLIPEYGSSLWQTGIPKLDADKKYLWSYKSMKLRYSYKVFTPVALTAQTDRTVIAELSDVNNEVTGITEYYGVSDSGEEPPSSYETSISKLSTKGKYVWNYRVISYSDGHTASSVESSKVVIIGPQNDGFLQLESVTDYYYAGSVSKIEDGQASEELVVEYKTVTEQTTSSTTNTKSTTFLNLKDGDIQFESFSGLEIVPTVKNDDFPYTINVTESLPDISCYDFMKSVFYMNGAMPKIARDRKTITAMYYNQIRDRVKRGEVLDWSRKVLTDASVPPQSLQYHNTKFAMLNYFEMAKSSKDKTQAERDSELDVYGDGYVVMKSEDLTLKDSTSIFKSCFYPPYKKNRRFPNMMVGNTIKLWEGDGTLQSSVYPVYGYCVQRSVDGSIEDTSVKRFYVDSGKEVLQLRMNVFDPFGDEDTMMQLFGYLQSILQNYTMIKEKMYLHELDLYEFDEAMPVYLEKYNSYFAVSTIQRSKDGVCTVELIKLP